MTTITKEQIESLKELEGHVMSNIEYLMEHWTGNMPRKELAARLRHHADIYGSLKDIQKYMVTSYEHEIKPMFK